MDLKAFSGENFEVQDWINQTFKQPEAQQNKEQFASSLVMKLQLLISKLNTSIEEQSDAVCKNIPRILRETDSLQQEAMILQTKMSAVQAEIDKVNEETGSSMEALVKMDTFKARIQSTNQALKEADNWTTLSAEIEDALDSADLNAIAAKLAGIQSSLKILSHVPDYEDRVIHVESLKNRLEALASPQLVSAFNSSDAEKSKFFVKIFTDMEREQQLLKYYRKCLKARLLKLWEKTVAADSEASDVIGLDSTDETSAMATTTRQREATVLEWLTSFTEQLESIVKEQKLWLADVFPSADSSECLVLVLTEVFSGLDPKLDFCLEAGIKQQENGEVMTFLTKVKAKVKSHLDKLDVLFGQGHHDASHRELGRLLYAPFKSHMAKYATYETTDLTMDLSSVMSPQSKDIIDELRHVAVSVPKILEVFTRASKRCCDLTEGCAYPALVGVIEESLTSYLERFTGLMRRLDKRKTSSHSWTIFQQSLTLNQAVGELLLGLEQLDITLSIDFLERTKSFLGPNARERAFEQYHIFFLDSGALMRLDNFHERVQQGSNYPVLAPSLKIVTRICSELQSSTFSILFHPISEELMKITGLDTWSSLSAGSGSTEQEMPDFSFSPQEYITQVGQYLMTLPQHLEPYMTNENPALSRAFKERVFPYCSGVLESSDLSPADFILACLTRAVSDTYQGEILKIPALSANSTKQLACDLAYLGDILEDLGHSLSDGLNSILTLLKLAPKDYWVSSSGLPQKLVSTIRQMRNLDMSK